MTNVCLFCGKATTNPKYCSRSCAAKHTNTISPKRKRVYASCRVCGCHIDRRRKVCSACWLNEHKTLGDVTGRRNYQKHSQIRALARRSFSREGPKQCEVCGYSKYYEVCQIKAISDFEESALISAVNSRSNLIALCPNCHWELDNGLLIITQHPRIPSAF